MRSECIYHIKWYEIYKFSIAFFLFSTWYYYSQSSGVFSFAYCSFTIFYLCHWSSSFFLITVAAHRYLFNTIFIVIILVHLLHLILFSCSANRLSLAFSFGCSSIHVFGSCVRPSCSIISQVMQIVSLLFDSMSYSK